MDVVKNRIAKYFTDWKRRPINRLLIRRVPPDRPHYYMVVSHKSGNTDVIYVEQQTSAFIFGHICRSSRPERIKTRVQYPADVVARSGDKYTFTNDPNFEELY